MISLHYRGRGDRLVLTYIGLSGTMPVSSQLLLDTDFRLMKSILGAEKEETNDLVLGIQEKVS